MNYLSIQSVSESDFQNRRIDTSDLSKVTKSDAADVRKMENMLDLREDALKGTDYFVEKMQCSCGRVITFSDFIFTALIEQWHDPSFLAHTLVGNKYIINEPRPMRCSACGSRQTNKDGITIRATYDCGCYGCSYEARR